MTKIKALVCMVALIAIAASAEARGKRRTVIEPEPTPTPSVSPTATPSPMPTVAVKGLIGFKCTKSCTDDERKRVQQAQVVANQIVQTECFSKFMKRVGLLDEDGNKYSAQEVNEIIKELTTTALTVPVHYYYSRANVVGYRNIGEPDIYFNRRYHDFYNACDTASNGTHEWSHSIGYDHPFNPTSWRGRTVPYALNGAFDSCCSDSQGFRGTFEVK